MTTLRLGTRGSQLALIQANMVAALLRARAGVSCDVIVIRTSGDRLADAPLAQIGGKRVFVRVCAGFLRLFGLAAEKTLEETHDYAPILDSYSVANRGCSTKFGCGSNDKAQTNRVGTI